MSSSESVLEDLKNQQDELRRKLYILCDQLTQKVDHMDSCRYSGQKCSECVTIKKIMSSMIDNFQKYMGNYLMARELLRSPIKSDLLKSPTMSDYKDQYLLDIYTELKKKISKDALLMRVV